MPVVAILFIILGILIKYGKMHFLIAGYNTMSKKERENYNIEGIATVFRNVMFVMSLLIFVGYFIARFTKTPQIQNYFFFISLVIGLPYLLITVNSKKYKNQRK